MAAILDNLATVSTRGKLAEAEASYGKALAIREQAPAGAEIDLVPTLQPGDSTWNGASEGPSPSIGGPC
ncbi:MAG: tetratricopeptide repeat protein [Singulisphaera sp.]